MAQDYPNITGTDQSQAAAFLAAESRTDSLRSTFQGATAPTNPVTGQHWYDGTDEWRWNGTAWELIAPLLQTQTAKGPIDASNSATILFYAFAEGTVSRVRILPNATVALDGTNYFSVQCHNVTQALDLFSVAPGTDTAGWTAGTVVDFSPDQNDSVNADDMLRVTITASGTPTALDELGVELKILNT